MGRELSDGLLYVKLKIISNKECQKFFKSPIFETHLCVSTLNLKSSSHGDSGGALILETYSNPIQIGIMSFGSDKGFGIGYPVVYTRLNSYLPWIEEVTELSFTNEVY